LQTSTLTATGASSGTSRQIHLHVFSHAHHYISAFYINQEKFLNFPDLILKKYTAVPQYSGTA
jgi:hypothetical protein